MRTSNVALLAISLMALAPLSLAQSPAATTAPAEPASQAASQPASKPVDKDLRDMLVRREIGDKVAPSLVRVEYTLKYDKGRTPLEELVIEERPLECAGFLVAATRVVSDDVTLHGRYIKSIQVRCGGQCVAAKPVGWAKDSHAVILELAEPLAAAKPLAFDANLMGPFYAVYYGFHDGEWTTTVSPLTHSTSVTESNRPFASVPTGALVVAPSGQPVGLHYRDEAPLDNTWKGSPLDWAFYSPADMEQMLKKVEQAADKAILRVNITFRSAKKDARSAQENPGPGEINDTAVLIDKQTVLVLMYSDPKYTARIERITVYPPSGEPVGAKFAYSLSDYGCFVATLDKPLDGAVDLCVDNVLNYRHKLLLTAEVTIQGENRVAYFGHNRINLYAVGWRRQIYPRTSTESFDYFFFNTDGKLVVMPLYRRNKVSLQGKQRTDHPLDTPVCYLKEAMDKLPASADKYNVPLTEEQENRLAWLGVELQPLDRELARARNVSHLTRDGQTGAMVSYVYDDSPAAKEGIKAGDILLRLYADDQPKPIEIIGNPPRFNGPYPWAVYDDIPEQNYDRLPTPWNPAETILTRVLTDLGFGKEFQVEFVRDSNTFTRSFAVAESPQHYNSAPTFKPPGLGLSVRDLTYEVRRYFQKKPDDPGVIVAIVTPGGKAAVAGLKPYEIITEVNDVPVKDIKQFEKLIKDQSELRLGVSRMTQGRTVKIKAAATEPAAAPAMKESLP